MESVNYFKEECKGNIPGGRSFHKCVFINEEKILMFGGCNYTNDSPDAYTFNLSNCIFI